MFYCLFTSYDCVNTGFPLIGDPVVCAGGCDERCTLINERENVLSRKAFSKRSPPHPINSLSSKSDAD